ncbi:hypothetical protein GCM10020256_12010 [Streptomyces thermocoprophilus]
MRVRGPRQAAARRHGGGHQWRAIVRRPFEQGAQGLGEGLLTGAGSQQSDHRAKAVHPEVFQEVCGLVAVAESGQDLEAAERVEQFGLGPVVRVGAVTAAGLLGGEGRAGLVPVRMHLDGQRLLGGQHLQQERQSAAEPPGAGAPQLPVRIAGHGVQERRGPSVAGQPRGTGGMGAHPQLRLRPGRRGVPPLQPGQCVA